MFKLGAAALAGSLLFSSPTSNDVRVGGFARPDILIQSVGFNCDEIYADEARQDGSTIVLSDSIIVSAKKGSPLANELRELGKQIAGDNVK